MSKWQYSKEELAQYFSDPRKRAGEGDEPPSETPSNPSENQQFAQARTFLAIVLGITLFVTLGIGFYMLTLADELPPLEEIENPNFQLATIAYTADGEELARYARQNRNWATFGEISPHVINALIATEDHRFYNHWGIDLWRTFSSVTQTVLNKLKVPGFDQQGGSTLSQQLARNLYNKRIGKEVTVGRKLKEMVTAVHLERRYTKQEIIEMYLNTVEFGFNAFGIESASRTFFGKNVYMLDEKESATLVGMLKGITYYNPVRNPENARLRRNVVMKQMVKRDVLSEDFYAEHNEDPVVTQYHSSEITASLAPYFAEYVRNWMNDWGEISGYDVYRDGLIVYTTLDSRMQELAQQAVEEQMSCLQAVVNYEWSRSSSLPVSTDACSYKKRTGFTPFSHFWKSNKNLLKSFPRETQHYRSLRKAGLSAAAAVDTLMKNEAFMDSLKTIKSRLEAGLVGLDPRTGQVKIWVGGRDLSTDWYDHVALAKRQPGSTFKPFVYTAAIHNGWSPYYTLRDTLFTYTDTAGNVWSPTNTGGVTGNLMTLREGLAHSKNTITGQLILEVGASEVAFFARRMGIKSELDEVPSLALGTSDVKLLEMASAYSTLANGGLYYEPTAVIRIEDRFGNVLYESHPAPQEALSEETAYTVVDMMRGVIQEGTGVRIRHQFKLGDYDLAGKTGTTQNSADGWFMMMHPDLVTGAWVGFNDRRIAFKTDWWGQGAHNALFLVGDFFSRATKEDVGITNTRFPTPFGYVEDQPDSTAMPTLDKDNRRDRGRVGW